MNFFGHMAMSDIAGLSCIFIFSFLRSFTLISSVAMPVGNETSRE